MGRKPKLTKEVTERAVQAIKAGNYNVVAAQFAGVTERTFYSWIEKGESAERKSLDGETLTDDEASYLHFLQSIRSARNELEVRHTLSVNKAAEKDWRAAAWFLERSFPSRWGRNLRAEVTGRDGGAIPVSVSWAEAVKRAHKAESASADPGTVDDDNGS